MIRVCTLSAGDSMLTELAQAPITAAYFSVASQYRRALRSDGCAPLRGAHRALLLVGMMNGRWPARGGHLIPVHLTTHGSTGRLVPAHRSQNHAARGEGGPQAWQEKGGQQRTVPRSASGCHSLSSRHHC
jgi:hypothetical protein